MSTTRKLLWGLLTAAIFFAMLELVLALAGVRPYTYTDDPYVGFDSALPLFERQRDAAGNTWLETAPNKRDWFNVQRFALAKPAGTVRVFCVGGSTTYGRPYDDATSFCGWLRELLPVFDDTRRWEVINAGGISYASYRVAKVMEELAAHEPDVFVIYSGHNEFLEERTYRDVIATPRAVSTLVLLASRTRVFGALRRARDASRPGPTAPEELSDEVETVLDGWIGPESFERDDEQRQRILDHFAFNLHRMVEIARSAGALPVLVTPASNLRDCEPFRSIPSAATVPADRERIDRLLSEASRRERDGDPAAALALLDQALALDPRVAAAHYRRGRALWALGRLQEAGEALRRARNEDVCPLRALDDTVAIVRRTAAATGAPLVDYERMLAVRADGAPGEDLFLDHVHPTVEGHRLLAEALLSTLADEGVAHPEAAIDEETLARVAERVRGGIDREAHARALRNLAKVLGWAGKVDEPERLALQALETLPDDLEALFIAGTAAQRQGRTDDAVRFYRRTLAVDPTFHKAHQNLGVLLFEAGDLAGAERHFRAVCELRPALADGPVNLGAVLVDAGRLDEAIDAYRRALELAPERPGPRYELAWLLAESGDVAAALSTLKPALDDPSPANARYTLGLALYQRGRHPRAYEQLSAALGLRPGDADIHNSLGVVAVQLGRREAAVEHFRAALRAAPGHRQARHNLAALGGG